MSNDRTTWGPSIVREFYLAWWLKKQAEEDQSNE